MISSPIDHRHMSSMVAFGRLPERTFLLPANGFFAKI
jgi:hypothetical protein